jgi:uncharacterized membrane protein YukC
MKYRALESFSGALSMHVGEVRDLNNKDIIKDLLKAKFIEEVKPEKPSKEKELQSEIEALKKQIEELTKEPDAPVETDNTEQETSKDVKPDESK